MKILIAEDDALSRRMLEVTLVKAGHEVVTTRDGGEALGALTRDGAPKLLILDWMMPVKDGPEVCRELRVHETSQPHYIILLTARTQTPDIVEGLQAGADDYMTKPFEGEELLARVQVGRRMLELQASLADRVRDLEAALAKVKLLQGLLPICSYCKKIRNDKNYWLQVDTYVAQHSEARFSHGICPECYENVVKPEMAKLTRG